MSGGRKFTPIYGRVLLERVIEGKTAGGIIIPDEYKKRHAEMVGKVVKVGNTVDPVVRALLGKEVIFARFSGDWLTLGGEEDKFYICLDEDILGPLEDFDLEPYLE